MASERDRFPVLLGTRRYEIDLSALEMDAIESTRQMVDQGLEPGEQSLSNQGIWKRTQEDFRLGAGQEFFDLVAEDSKSSRRRFRASFNIDPWSPRAIKLLRKTSQRASSTADNNRLLLCGGYVYWISGGTIKRVSDPMADPWSTTTCTDSGGVWAAPTVVNACTDGSIIYLCFGAAGSALWKITGTELDPFGAEKADLLGYAKGRLFGTAGPDLFELDSAGVKTDIWTHTNANFDFSVITEAPNAVYVAGNNGDHGEIYACTIIEQSTAIDAPFHAASLPDGETINAMAWYGGVMVLGTSKGVRIASINGAGFLGYGPLIPVGGDTRRTTLAADATTAASTVTVSATSSELDRPTVGSYMTVAGEVLYVSDVSGTTINVNRAQLGTTAKAHTSGSRVEITTPIRGVSAIEPQGQFCYFTWRDPTNYRTGLGRLDLARYTAELVPAFSVDASATYGGVETQGAISSVITWTDSSGTGREYRAFTLNYSTSDPAAAGGVWMETIFYNNYGDFRTGRITYGTPERKAFVSLEVWCKPLPAGASIVCYALQPDGTQTTLGTISTAGTTQAKFAIDIEDEWVELQFRLYAATQNGVTSATPEMERWTLRAVPMPYRSARIGLPVFLGRTKSGQGSALVKAWDDWNYLWGLWQDRSRVTLTWGDFSQTVVVDGPPSPTPSAKEIGAEGFTKERDWFYGVVMVPLLTVEDGL